MKRIIYFLRSFRKLKTISEAEGLGLRFRTNLGGDRIRAHGWSRSLWWDEFGNLYRCNELKPDGTCEIMEEMKIKHPQLFKPQ